MRLQSLREEETRREEEEEAQRRQGLSSPDWPFGVTCVNFLETFM